MTPSNPGNNQPLIYRICDAIGVFHLVAPVNHTHIYSEIPGLNDELSELWAAMNEKANSEAVNEALEAKADITTMNNALEGKMPSMPIDNEPELDSRSLVLSGGVAAALAEKAPLASTNVVYHEFGDGNPLPPVNQLFTGGNNQITMVIENVSGREYPMDYIFWTNDSTGIITPDDPAILPADSVMVCRVIYCPNMNTPYEKYIVVLDRLIGW